MSNRTIFPVSFMLTTAFLWPSEAAIGGDGLHLVLGWLAVGIYALLVEPPESRKRGWHDWVPIVLLLVGFWLSTWHVFRIEGDRRSALNLAFEWTAIGAAWWLVRQLKSAGLRTVLLLIVGLGFGASALGIVQYHVSNRMQAEWYLAKRDLLDAASPGARHAIESGLRSMGVPADGVSRQLFEGRLLASSEPIGPFALANTLGGLLAVVVVLLVAGVLNELDSRDRRGALFWFSSVLLMGVVGYCLVLTKSRTAWAGSLAGVAFLFGRRLNSFRAWLTRAAVLAVVVVVAGGVGIVSGAIDREVVLEATKSLQYRLFYWMGAAGVIAESPVFGSGPGNFRQSYLAYKVPESSEEVLDPHNIFVDAWCSAGLLGLLAMVLMVVYVVRGRRREEIDSPKAALPFTSSLMLVKSIAVGAAIHLLWRWIGGSPLWDFDSEFFLSENLILVVPVAACFSAFFLCRSIRIPEQTAAPAFVCLVVHLLAAGGLQISICGLLLATLYAVFAGAKDTVLPESTGVTLLRRVAVLGGAAVFVAVAVFGLKPVLLSGHHLRIAAAKALIGDKNAAATAYRQAINADSLSVESRQRNAEFLAYALLGSLGQYAPTDGGRVMELPKPMQDQYTACKDACQELIDSDRKGIRGYLVRSQIRLAKWEYCSNADVLNRAIGDLEHVVRAYPTNASVWADLAVACEQSGDWEKSGFSGQRALAQEKINRNWGHIDRYLSNDVLDRLKRIVSSSDNSK